MDTLSTAIAWVCHGVLPVAYTLAIRLKSASDTEK